MKPSTINMRLALLGVVFNFHQIPDEKNPLKKIRKLAEDNGGKRDRVATDFELNSILQDVSDPELQDYIFSLRYTAFRADITGVRTEWKEVLFREEKINIPKEKNKGKKGKKRPYDIDIDGRLFPVLLRRYELCKNLTIEKARELYPVLSKHTDEEIAPVLLEAKEYVFPDYIFRERLGGHCSLYEHVAYTFRKISRMLGIVDLTLHDLRRTAGSEFYINSGKDIILTRDFLGHSDIVTTQKYLHIKTLEHTSDKKGTQPVQNNPYKATGTGKAPEGDDLSAVAA